MYGETGPPKGYSAPRDGDVSGAASRRWCQVCASSQHWTFECSRKKTRATATSAAAVKTATTAPRTRLSRTQMLRYGVQPRRVEFVPAPTEREQYHAELRELESALIAEAKAARERDAAAAAAQQQQQQHEEQQQQGDDAACGVQVKTEEHDNKDTTVMHSGGGDGGALPMPHATTLMPPPHLLRPVLPCMPSSLLASDKHADGDDTDDRGGPPRKKRARHGHA